MNEQADPAYADIEIYLANTELGDIISWLKHRFLSVALDTQATDSATTHHFLAKTETTNVNITIVERILDGYSSVFFDSPNTPWEVDLDCARDAHRHLQVEVRCCAGSWSPEQNPDEWLTICQEGETVITW